MRATLALFAVLVLTFAGVAIVPETAGATVPGAVGRIVFVSDRDHSYGEIYTRSFPGGAWTRLTSDSATDEGPAWSPDGAQIAYRSDAAGTWDIWVMNTDGSGYSHLHEFAGGANDGEGPTGSLTLSGSTLYGMTRDGGDHDDGTVFKMNTDGTGFDLLHEFAGGDGIWPTGSLTLSGSTLYGTTIRGEYTYNGVVFKMNTDGSGYSLVHEFFGGADDGDEPRGSLILSGSTLYGMTEHGGDYNQGVIFALTIPEPSTLLLLAPALLGFAGLVLKRRK